MPKSKGRRKPKRARPVTATPPKEDKTSPKWYVALMFGLMAAGVAVIIVNYIGIFPGGTNNKYLFMGLGSMAVGFGMTLWFH
jgi:hypothetical protein